MAAVIKEKLNNPAYLREIGIEVLKEQLGAVGAAMFLQQFEIGSGDYTKEKYKNQNLNNMTIDDIKKELESR